MWLLNYYYKFNVRTLVIAWFGEQAFTSWSCIKMPITHSLFIFPLSFSRFFGGSILRFHYSPSLLSFNPTYDCLPFYRRFQDYLCSALPFKAESFGTITLQRLKSKLLPGSSHFNLAPSGSKLGVRDRLLGLLWLHLPLLLFILDTLSLVRGETKN